MIDTDTQTVHYLSTEPAREQRQDDSNKRQHECTVAGHVGIPAPDKPTDDEQHNNNHVSSSMP